EKRHEARPFDRPPQFPYRDALNDQAEGDDQRGSLRRREEMQPHRGGDDAEGEAGEAGDKRRGKRPGGEQGEIEYRESVHGVPHAGPPRARAAGDGATLGRPKWLRGGCLDLRLFLGSGRAEVNRPWRKISGLVGATVIAYISGHGVGQTPRQTAVRPS